MNASMFNPYVRYAAMVNQPHPFPKLYCAYDYRLFYIQKGTISIEFLQETVSLSAGDLITIPPATPYRLVFPSDFPMQYYVVNFDFDSEKAFTAPNPPDFIDAFQPENVFSYNCLEPFAATFLLHHADSLAPTIVQLLHEHHPLEEYSVYTVSSLMKYLLMQVLMLAKKQASQLSRQSETLINEIKHYIAHNCTENISNSTIANRWGYHPNYLNALFVKSEGVTIHKYLMEIRIRKAKELLLSSNKTIYEISNECGFSGASYFCECFIKQYGVSPAKFRESSK